MVQVRVGVNEEVDGTHGHDHEPVRRVTVVSHERPGLKEEGRRLEHELRERERERKEGESGREEEGAIDKARWR